MEGEEICRTSMLLARREVFSLCDAHRADPMGPRWINWYKHSPTLPSYNAVLVVPNSCWMSWQVIEGSYLWRNREYVVIVRGDSWEMSREMAMGFYIGNCNLDATPAHHYLFYYLLDIYTRILHKDIYSHSGTDHRRWSLPQSYGGMRL